MKISIITPSFNSKLYLMNCSASIADQQGVSVEHIVMDGNSTDGTVEWLQQQKKIIWLSEKDSGMYDAVNKGLKIASGEIIGYLNCDEQYLPGTLKTVSDYFDTHHDVDMLFGDMLLIASDGNLIAYRKSFVPKLKYIYSSFLYSYSCTMFFRRKIVDAGLTFNVYRKAISDAEFVIDVIKNKYTIRHIKKYLSVFTLTDANLGASKTAANELSLLKRSAPIIIRIFRYPLSIMRLLEKIFRGNYFQKNEIQYSIFLGENTRRKFSVKRSSFMWKK